MIFRAHILMFLLCAIAVTFAQDGGKPAEDGVNDTTTAYEVDKKKTTTSPTTTTTAPTTTTPTPITTTPVPTTTTPIPTTPPPTTTPAPTTAPTTPAPTTTPVPVTTSAPTTSAPTPPTTPPPPPKDWVIVGDNGTVCIVANMAVKVTVPYKVAAKTLNAEFSVEGLNQAKATGNCLPGDVQNLMLAQPNVTYTFNFVRNATAKTYALGSVSIFILVNNNTFPNNNMTVKNITLVHSAQVFTLPLNNSYTCAGVPALPLNGTAGNTTVDATLLLSRVHVEAFGNETKAAYRTPLDCVSGETPDIVPIAVGLILAGLVVVVLIAYLVGRRRAQARGYLSM